VGCFGVVLSGSDFVPDIGASCFRVSESVSDGSVAASASWSDVGGVAEFDSGVSSSEANFGVGVLSR
jgi:hypothetical protein